MTRPILQTRSGICYICRKRGETALHHIYGAANRWMSDENGFTVFLCPECHTESPSAVHRCHETDVWLKARCQRVYEKKHTRADFMRLVGKNYL